VSSKKRRNIMLNRKGKVRRQARAWLVRHGLTVQDIQEALDHKYHTQVSETLSGKRNDRAVLNYLVRKGCPASFLDLPDDMREVA